MAESVCCLVIISKSFRVSAFLHLARRFWNQIYSTNNTNQVKTPGNTCVCVSVCVANGDCCVITALPGYVISCTGFIGLKIHSFLSHHDTNTVLESRLRGGQSLRLDQNRVTGAGILS